MTWFETVWTLLKLARVRSKARIQSVLDSKNPGRNKSATLLTAFSFFGAIALAILSAYIFLLAATLPQEVVANQSEQILVSEPEYQSLRDIEAENAETLAVKNGIEQARKSLLNKHY